MTSPHQHGQQPTPPSTFPPAAGGVAGGHPQPPKAKSGSVKPALAVAAAFLAVVLGLVSVGLSWRASTKASDALDRIAALPTAQPVQPATDPTAPPTTEAPTPADDATPDEPTPETTGTDPELSKETQFGVKYTNETLRLPANCDTSVYVDVDEPRVRVDSEIADFRFYDQCGVDTPYINLSQGVRGSVADAENVTPTQCVDLIRRSPLSTGNLPLRQGQVYCINTSRATALQAADTWKMVIMSITAISSDGTVTIKASSWTIPE